MNTIRPGRYLVSVETPRVKRARAGHAYLSIGVRILRDLMNEPHRWVGLVAEGIGSSTACASCGIIASPGMGGYCLARMSETRPSELVEAILSTRSGAYESDVRALGVACGVTLELPATPNSTDAFQRYGWDKATEDAMRPLTGKLAVVTAQETGQPRRRNQDPFVATTWSAPTPLDGFQNPTLPECLALLGRVYRELKAEDVRHHERVDRVLRLLDSLNVPV